jgi:hypothetical protein
VQGKLEVGEERAQIIASDISPLQQLASKTRPKATPAVRKSPDAAHENVHFYLQVPQVEPHELRRLRETLLQFPGHSLVFLHLVSAEGETVIELPDRLRVAPEPRLAAEVEKVFGPRISATP